MTESKNITGKDFDFLIGKKIVSVKDNSQSGSHTYELTTDDGVVFVVETNDGCGGCSNGWSELGSLVSLLNADHIITNVKTIYDKNSNDRFSLFVFYGNDKIVIEGDDGYGNGYYDYGGGFWLTIKE